MYPCLTPHARCVVCQGRLLSSLRAKTSANCHTGVAQIDPVLATLPYGQTWIHSIHCGHDCGRRRRPDSQSLVPSGEFCLCLCAHNLCPNQAGAGRHGESRKPDASDLMSAAVLHSWHNPVCSISVHAYNDAGLIELCACLHCVTVNVA